jgi:tellurite resistance protein TerC
MVIWIIFLVLIFFLLALDLGLFNRTPHTISTREALGWTTLWVSISILFSIVVYFTYELEWLENSMTGQQAVLKYLTGYLVELSLSMDNIFVIALIFAYFQIPERYQHRVLFWGILGALFFRGMMIGIGVVLIHQFEWIIYVFGALLLYSAYKMLTSGESVHPNRNPVINWVKRFFPVTKEFHREHFFVKRRHITAATPLFIALMVIETTDIMFAVDSIPAIFAITTEPFLVFTSNIFAILGLRSMYFVLASMLNKFYYLKYSLVGILFFVGIKMLLQHAVELPEWLSLTIILLSLGSGIAVSLLRDTPEPPEEAKNNQELMEKAKEEKEKEDQSKIDV